MTREQKIAILANVQAQIAIASVVYQSRMSLDSTRKELGDKAGVSVERWKELEAPNLEGNTTPFTPEEMDRVASVVGEVDESTGETSISHFQNFEELWAYAEKRFPSDMNELQKYEQERLQRLSTYFWE